MGAVNYASPAPKQARLEMDEEMRVLHVRVDWYMHRTRNKLLVRAICQTTI